MMCVDMWIDVFSGVALFKSDCLSCRKQTDININ